MTRAAVKLIQPVLVEAPARFAIIAPDIPAPKVIIASGEQVSDLVGYYSIKEAGLEGVITKSTVRPFEGIFAALLRSSVYNCTSRY